MAENNIKNAKYVYPIGTYEYKNNDDNIFTGNRWMFETKYTHFSKRTADYVSTTITTKQHHLLLSTTRQ